MFARYLEYFFVVAECRSITAAAERLFISPSALQQQMNKLESETGLKLFERDSKGVVLNPTGEKFLKGMQKIKDDYTNLLEACSEGKDKERKIRIGANSILLPDLFPKVAATFARECPNIIQEPVMDTEEKLFEMLDAGQIDLIEYYDCANAHKHGRKYYSVLTEGRDCLVSPRHPLAARKEVSIEDLVEYDISVYRFDRIPGFKEYMQEHFPEAKLSERPQKMDFYSLVRSFEDGHVTLSPPHLASAFAPLVSIPLKLPLTWSLGFVYKKGNEAVVQEYLEIARRVFEK